MSETSKNKTVTAVELTSGEGMLLGTAGKYCRHDILVRPRLQPLSITENGTYPVPRGFAGNGQISVKVAPREETELIVTANGTYTAPPGTVYTAVTVRVPGATSGRPHLCSYTEQTVAPTCTEGGYRLFTCTVCGGSYRTDETPPLGHDYRDGFCTRCHAADPDFTPLCESRTLAVGESFTVTYHGSSPQLSHGEHLRVEDDGGVLTVTAQSEGTDLLLLYAADGETVLAAYTVRVTEAAEDSGTHTHRYTETVTDPTCETEGYTTHTCSVCGHSYRDTPTPALGHDWGEPFASEIFADGYGRVCARCGARDESPACDHAVTEAVRTAEPTCTAAGEMTYTCTLCGASWTAPLPMLAHTYEEKTVAPTCEKEGYTVHTCTACGKRYTDGYLPAAGHRYLSAVTAPTCTEGGYTTHTCSVCGHSYTSDLQAPLGHLAGEPKLTREASCTVPAEYTVYCTRCGVELDRYEDDGAFADHIEDGGTVTAEPTCTEAGKRTYRCLRCGTWLRDETVPPLPHTYESVVTAPTCTEGGYTTHTCTVCGDSYTDSETDPAGHNFAGGWQTVTEADCETGGKEKRVCLTCGHTETRSTAPAGHRYEAKVTAPTCTEGGYTTHTCTACGDSYTDGYTDPTGHNFAGGWQTVTEADCEEGGEEKRVCLTCGHTETRATAPTGHSYKKKVTKPTCTEGGYTTHTCTACGHSYTDSETAPLGHAAGTPVLTREPTCTVPAEYAVYCTRCGVELDRYENDGEFADHIPDGGRVTVEPTCTEAGKRTYLCRICGAFVRDETVPATGHSLTSVTTAPTCTEGGYTTHTCSTCGYTYTDSETAPLGHAAGAPVLTREPTCTVPAEYAVYCTRCGVELDRYENDGEFADHIEDGGRVTVEPTCTEAGVRSYHCRECGTRLRDETITAKGHSYKPKLTEPTCEEGGYTTYTCSRCGDSYVTNRTDPTGHNFASGWQTVTEADCEEGGEEKRVCLTCGHTETRTTDPLGHDAGTPTLTREPTCTAPAEYATYCTRCGKELDRWEDDGEFADHIEDGGRVTEEPTCTEAGTRTYYCRECGTWIRDETVPALGHAWGEPEADDSMSSGYSHTCTRCGAVEEC